MSEVQGELCVHICLGDGDRGDVTLERLAGTDAEGFVC